MLPKYKRCFGPLMMGMESVTEHIGLNNPTGVEVG